MTERNDGGPAPESKGKALEGRLIEDCKMASKCLAETNTFESGQSIFNEIAWLLETGRLVSRTTPPADPAPVVWPDGVTNMGASCGSNVAICDNELIDLTVSDGLRTAEEARQLAALLIAAANKLGGK